MNKIHIFSDGACSGNPGPGGWGAILAILNGKTKEVTELGGAQNPSTNNRMELYGVIASFHFLNDRSIDHASEINVYSDSVYVLKGITQWVHGWQKRGWLTAEGKEVLNKDLWIELKDLVRKYKKIQWNYFRGHQGTPANERCDEIAVAFSKKNSIYLYQGAMSSYDIDIFKLPEDMSIPDNYGSGSKEKKTPYSYLSLLGGKVERHADWASCERRVRGQSGAKFKKAMSAEEEQEIIRSWSTFIR